MAKFKEEKYISQWKKDGLWMFRVRYKNFDKYFGEKTYHSSRIAYEKAIEYRNMIVADTQNGIEVKSDNPTLQELLEESVDLFPLRVETKRKLNITLNNHIGGSDRRIKQIKKADIIMSLNKLVNSKSSDTISRALSVWKRLFKTAILKEYIYRDLTIGIIPPKSQLMAKPKKKVIIDRESFDKILCEVDNKIEPKESKQVHVALELMWYTGLRPAECFALNVDDIKNGLINVNKELGTEMATSDATDEITVRRCKTDASIRQVPIPTNLKKILRNYHSDSFILFPNRFGTYFNITNLGQRLHRFDNQFNMYQLRHTVATRLVTNGVDERTIIEILGHEKFDMSIYYARSNDELKKKALE